MAVLLRLGFNRRGMRLRRHRVLRLAPGGVRRGCPRHNEHLGRGEREQNLLCRRPFVELGRRTTAPAANICDGRSPGFDPRATVGFTLAVGFELLLPTLLLELAVLLLCFGCFGSHRHPSRLLLAHRRHCIVTARRASEPRPGLRRRLGWGLSWGLGRRLGRGLVP